MAGRISRWGTGSSYNPDQTHSVFVETIGDWIFVVTRMWIELQLIHLSKYNLIPYGFTETDINPDYNSFMLSCKLPLNLSCSFRSCWMCPCHAMTTNEVLSCKVLNHYYLALFISLEIGCFQTLSTFCSNFLQVIKPELNST